MEYIDLIPDENLDIHEFGRVIHQYTDLYNQDQLQALYVIWMIEYEKYLKGLVKKAKGGQSLFFYKPYLAFRAPQSNLLPPHFKISKALDILKCGGNKFDCGALKAKYGL